MMYIQLVSVGCMIVGFIMILIRLLKQRAVLRQKENEVSRLQAKIDEVRGQLTEYNRRKAYRVELLETDCKLRFIDFGESSFVHLHDKEGIVHILDISYSGMQIECEYDFPIVCSIVAEAEFTILGEKITVNARFIRKVGHYIEKKITYGLEFVQMTEQRGQQIFRLINSLEVERRKKRV